MRILTHPDKLKKPGMTEADMAEIDAKAASVGQAVDLLTNDKEVSASTLLRKTYTERFNSVGYMTWKWGFENLLSSMVCDVGKARR